MESSTGRNARTTSRSFTDRDPSPRSTAGERLHAGAGLPFDRRVAVLVEIADNRDETALAEELFAQRGWPARAAEERERAGCLPERVARVVEVRLTGARNGAVERALGMVDQLAVAASLKMWARDAVLLEYEPEQYTAWRVRADSEASRLSRVLRVVEPRGRAGALSDLRARELAGQRGTSAVDLDPADGTSVDVKANLILVNIGNLMAFIAAVLTIATHGGWQDFGGTVSALFGLPWLIAGIRHALRDSTARRVVAWSVPLAAPVLLPFVTWIGALVQDRYIDAFGIPTDSVHTGATDRLWAGALPVAGVLYFMAFGAAASGWNRRFHADPNGFELSNVAFAAGLGLAVGVMAVLMPFVVFTTAAVDAQSAVADFRQPPSYYGLRPLLVCVRPVAHVAQPWRGFPGASYGGTVPLTYPVLTFGPDADRIWLWDPRSHEAFNMNLTDATFVPFDRDSSTDQTCL